MAQTRLELPDFAGCQHKVTPTPRKQSSKLSAYRLAVWRPFLTAASRAQLWSVPTRTSHLPLVCWLAALGCSPHGGAAAPDPVPRPSAPARADEAKGYMLTLIN